MEDEDRSFGGLYRALMQSLGSSLTSLFDHLWKPFNRERATFDSPYSLSECQQRLTEALVEPEFVQTWVPNTGQPLYVGRVQGTSFSVRWIPSEFKETQHRERHPDGRRKASPPHPITLGTLTEIVGGTRVETRVDNALQGVIRKVVLPFMGLGFLVYLVIIGVSTGFGFGGRVFYWGPLMMTLAGAAGSGTVFLLLWMAATAMDSDIQNNIFLRQLLLPPLPDSPVPAADSSSAAQSPVSGPPADTGEPGSNSLSVKSLPPVRETSAPDGTRLVYEIRGSGPALFLLHDFAGDRSMWHKSGWVRYWMNLFTVITPDLRGCGESGRPEGEPGYALERYVADIEAVAEACGIDQFRVAGWSSGATLGLHLATRSSRVVKAGVLAPYLGRDFNTIYLRQLAVIRQARQALTPAFLTYLKALSSWPAMELFPTMGSMWVGLASRLESDEVLPDLTSLNGSPVCIRRFDMTRLQMLAHSDALFRDLQIFFLR